MEAVTEQAQAGALEDRLPDCPICGSSESALVQKGARHAPEAEVRRCGACGLVFLWPRPPADDLARYYETSYREDYGELPVEKRYLEDLPEARRRVERLRALLAPDVRVLEIGCGSGAFLDAVRPYVEQLQGVEPDRESRTWIEGRLGLSVVSELGALRQQQATFDLVVMFHVLEHLPDPLAFLRSLPKSLRAGAKVVIEVPNLDDALVSLYQIPACQRFYYQKAHLLYFSSDTLKRTLDRSGFGAEIRGVQRYDLSNHIRWMLTGEPGGQGFYDSTLPDAVDASYAEALIRAGRSDTLWAVAHPSVVPLTVLDNGVGFGGALDFGEDILCRSCPDKGLGRLVARFQVLVDGGLEFGNTAEHAAADALLCQLAEPALDEIEPRRRRGNEVKVEAGVLREPLLHLLMLMRGVVVHDQMQLQRRWRFAIDLA